MAIFNKYVTNYQRVSDMIISSSHFTFFIRLRFFFPDFSDITRLTHILYHNISHHFCFTHSYPTSYPYLYEVLKLMACAMQQKLIGERLGKWTFIRAQVGINQPMIRALEAGNDVVFMSILPCLFRNMSISILYIYIDR